MALSGTDPLNNLSLLRFRIRHGAPYAGRILYAHHEDGAQVFGRIKGAHGTRAYREAELERLDF